MNKQAGPVIPMIAMPLPNVEPVVRVAHWTKRRPSEPGWYCVRMRSQRHCTAIVPIYADDLPIPPNEFSELEFSDAPVAWPIEPEEGAL